MFSLKPKEGGTAAPPPPPPITNLLKGGLALALVLILGLGYNAYSTRAALQDQIDILGRQLADQTSQMKSVKKNLTDTASDVDVVRKRVGVTAAELDVSRKFAEKLKTEQEQAKQQLASEIATKASTSDVAAVRQEATTKAAVSRT